MSKTHQLTDPLTRQIRRERAPKRLIVIPARMASRRLPGKPLVDIAGRSLLEWTCRAASRVPDAQVVVASPDREVCREARRIGVLWMPTSELHPTATHRAAEIVSRSDLPGNCAVAVWGVGEPLVDPRDVAGLLGWIESGVGPHWKLGALVAPLDDEVRRHPETIKAAVSLDRCHWFSRAPMLGSMGSPFVFGYSRGTLVEIVGHQPSELSEAEDLEQLTWIEAGWAVTALAIPELPPSVRGPEDLERVRKELIQ